MEKYWSRQVKPKCVKEIVRLNDELNERVGELEQISQIANTGTSQFARDYRDRVKELREEVAELRSNKVANWVYNITDWIKGKFR